MRFFNLLRLLLALALTSHFASAQQPWRYDFRTGDHLVYSELLEKESTGQDFQQKSRISFTSHVLVLGESNGAFSIGTQRNRNSATLVSYRGGGKEAAQQQLVRFQ